MRFKMLNAPKGADVTIYDESGCWWIEVKWEKEGAIQREVGENLSVNAINKMVKEFFPENTNYGLCRQ